MKVKTILENRLNAVNSQHGKVVSYKMDINYEYGKIGHTLKFDKFTSFKTESIEDGSEYVEMVVAKLTPELRANEILYIGVVLNFTDNTQDTMEVVYLERGVKRTVKNALKF